MQYIVWMPSSKQAEYTTPYKAYIPTYPRKVELLNLGITPAMLGTCASILHCTSKNT
jgi:hypothetical protein